MKRIMACLLVFILVFSFSACSGSAVSQSDSSESAQSQTESQTEIKNNKIILCTAYPDSAYRLMWQYGFASFCKANGYDYEIVGYTSDKMVNHTIDDVYALWETEAMADDVAGVIIVGYMDGKEDFYDKIRSAGKYLVIADCFTDPYYYDNLENMKKNADSVIYYDTKESSRLLADLMLADFEKDGVTDGFVGLQTTGSGYIVTMQTDYAKEKLEAKGFGTDYFNTFGDYDERLRLLNEFADVHPDMRAFFSVAPQADVFPRADMGGALIYECSSDPFVVQAIKDGTIRACVSLDGYEVAQMAAARMDGLIKGQDFSSNSTLPVVSEIITQDNAEEYLKLYAEAEEFFK